MRTSVPAEPTDDAVPESSLALLKRAQRGDPSTLDALLARYRPRLRRWAHRRLPRWARDLSETDDIVQDTLVKALRNLDTFVANFKDGFQNYLRLAIGNAIRDEVRKARRRPTATEIDPEPPVRRAENGQLQRVPQTADIVELIRAQKPRRQPTRANSSLLA